jgi:membrane-bound lytic murein transglycosylase D
VRELNPELRRFCTPPSGWTIRLPKGSRESFLAEYQKLGPSDRLSFVEHKVEKGEPIGKIARAYGVTESAILRTNGIKSYRQIKPGRMLVIPMAGASRGLVAGKQLEDKPAVRHASEPQARRAPTVLASTAPVPAAAGTYTVQPGDSLWTIAAKFSTTVDKLKRLNGLNGRRARSLQVGQTIAVRDS